ncbi:regulator of cell morphogenesis and NO signaling [Xylanibacter ruminicola]|uniref:Regulator of cell morphogenesis and NO signaling n=2 Tax=Xylanibacter ruminicola TaxID=839 RepID=A0A1H4EBJ2_XYLRU|nr:regulator of cell morphogenesis and NO signaling [Xylanibacter ruminicola]
MYISKNSINFAPVIINRHTGKEMKNQKMYEADDKMISLIRDNYDLLQALGSFGINLGFGDKTVRETCEDNDVDTYTFLAVVNYAMNGYGEFDNDEQISVPTLLHYLEASHAYFLEFQLPYIRRELSESLDENDSLGRLILKFYDEYAHEIRRHMQYEQKTLFPYVQQLIDGEPANDYNVETFSKHHGATDKKLRELKLLIIKYLPQDGLHNNQLTATLHDIYENEVWLRQHAQVEDHIFVPAIRRLEQITKQQDVTRNISGMVFGNATAQNPDALSDREKDVIISLVQGMSNKEIADHLCISINTVITHRRNIARKLQIHSPAGLTIYAIVNGLVDISTVKL